MALENTQYIDSASIMILTTGTELVTKTFAGNISCSVITSSTSLIGTTTLTSINPETLKVVSVNNTSVNVVSVLSNINNYSQLNITNSNTGPNVSSDLVVTSNLGNEYSYYVDLGINGSNYTGGFIGQTNDGYVYNTGSNFYLGNTSPTGSLFLFAGGYINTSSVILTNTGRFGIGLLNPTNSLDVVGNISCSVITASLLNGTSSWSANTTSASYAITASWSANSITSSFGVGIPQIQAGTTTALTTATGSLIKFNHSFPNTNYIVTLTASGSTGITGSRISGPLTTTGFTSSFISFTGYVQWLAVSIT